MAVEELGELAGLGLSEALGVAGVAFAVFAFAVFAPLELGVAVEWSATDSAAG